MKTNYKRLIKKNLVFSCTKNEPLFSKPYEPFGGDINVKVDLSNYPAKTDIKNISHLILQVLH